MYDIIIIGAGPAGLTAAIYAKRAGYSALLLEGGTPGGQAATTPDIENWPGSKQVSGPDFAMNLYEQAQALGTNIRFERVASLSDNGTHKTVTTGGNTYEGRTVIIANGVRRRPSRTANTANTAGAAVASNFADGSAASNEANGDNASAGEPAPKRRRRRSRKKTTSQTGAVDAAQTASANDSEVSAQPAAEPAAAPADGQPAEGETPAPRRRRRRRAKPKMDDVSAADNASVAPFAEDKAS